LIFWAISTALLFNILYVYQLEYFLLISEKKHTAEIKISKQQKEIFTSKYNSIKKQLNPHFLFNSFNSLSALINTDPKKADFFLQSLSEVYRYNLSYNEEIVITLENEMNLIEKYISLQQVRFGVGLEIRYNIASEKIKYLLPPMTLELLVENAIKHNIIEKTKPLQIRIITKENYVIVENNYQKRGNSLPQTDSLGLGLKNLTNQYELIHTEVPKFKVKNGLFQAIVPLIEPSL
jgi:LytS/YehU family sensor histidine kinase